MLCKDSIIVSEEELQSYLMINVNEYIGELVGKYLRQELTKEEQDRLGEWINASSENKKAFEKWIDTSELMQKLADWERVEKGKEAAWQQAEIKMYAVKKRSILLNRQWWKYAAAAVVVVTLSGIWLWLEPANNKNETGQSGITGTPAINDVPPGQMGARLTLADGSTIVLDNSSLGQLAKQGNTSVLNKGGQLVYDTKPGSKKEVLYNTLSTARGETYTLTLADGSQVWLNSASSVHYPVAFAEDESKVEITGEAYFEVAHNKAMPFTVLVNGMLIVVTGTSFNVNAYDDEQVIRTTLLEGSIKITPPGSNKAESVNPGQQIQVAGNNIVKVIGNANIEEAVAWKKGLFYFDRADITMVMKQLARWYNIEVVYEGTKPEQLFIGKMERDLNLSQVLKVLGKTEVNFRIEGQKIIVMP